MKTRLTKVIRQSVASGALVLIAILLLAASSQGQNLFESDYRSGNVYEFTPNGVQSKFAFGLSYPDGLACDSAGDLFVSCAAAANRVIEITPQGTMTTFAFGLSDPVGLVFQPIQIPEPSTWALVGLGLSALLVFRRRKA